MEGFSVQTIVSLLIVVFSLAQTKGQGNTNTNNGGGSPHGLDPNFIKDPFHNPNTNSYNDFNLYLDLARPSSSPQNSNSAQNPPYLNPSVYPSGTPTTPPSANHKSNLAFPNKGPNFNLGSSVHPSPNLAQGSQNNFATTPPPILTLPPTSPPPPASAVPNSMQYETGVPGKLEKGGPVFNSLLYSGQPGQPASLSNQWKTDTGASFGGGRLYTLPVSAKGQGLLERVANPHRHRQVQQQQQQPFNFFGNIGFSPLLFALALGGF